MIFKTKNKKGQLALINSNLDALNSGFENFIKENKNYNFKFYELEKERLELDKKRMYFDVKQKDSINLSKKEYLDLLEAIKDLKETIKNIYNVIK